MLLNKTMEEIVNKYVKAYKEDILYDFVCLLDKNIKSNKFYWIVRSSGTNMAEKNKTLIKGSDANHLISYYLNNEKKGIHLFEIIVEKRCIKNIYGEIKELNKKTFIEKLNNTKVSTDDIKTVEAIVKTKSQTKTVFVNYFENHNKFIYELCQKANLNKEDIEHLYLNYVI